MKLLSSGPLLIFCAAVLWGIDGVLRRFLYDLPPITIVLLEHVIGLIILSPFLYRAWKKETLTKKEWGLMGVLALLSGVLGTLFFTTALLKTNFISFSVVFLVQKLQPIFTFATAYLFLKERITKKQLLWSALALVAGYFVTFPNGVVNWSSGGAFVVAAGFALLAAAAWGSSTVISRTLLLKHSNTFITGVRFLLTVPIALIFVAGLGVVTTVTTVTSTQLGILAVIAVSTGMFALWIYYRGLKHTPASISAIIELAFPLTAIFIDYMLYGTVLAVSQYVAVAVLLFAMYNVGKGVVNKD